MARRQVTRFILVGVSAIAVDSIAYAMALQATLPTAVAKGCGSVAGTLYAYVCNRFFTFGGARGGWRVMGRYGLLYGTTILINVAANSVALWLALPVVTLLRLDRILPPMLWDDRALHIYAFCAATLLTAILNFLGLKHFVFRPPSPAITTR